MAFSMKRDIPAMSGAVFDLCIVGGGITGLCVAHDAAARGLKVALLERGDFSEGTSSASTKLVHGGTRYLEHAEFGLVREALRERRVLLKLAPHMTRPLPFMIPLYRKGPVAPTLIRTGMLMYDMLSYDKNRDALPDKLFPLHRYVSPEEAVSLEPELEAKDLLGASVYTDGQMPNPMRLALEFAKTAAGNGAMLANYARVTGLKVEGAKVVGVEALDRLTGKSFSVTAALTVNCAGIWATEVMKLLNLPLPVQLKPSKGIHVVTRPITKTHAVVSVSPTGRRVMIIPWRGKSLIGTTDDFYEGDIDRIRATTAEIQNPPRRDQRLRPLRPAHPGGRRSGLRGGAPAGEPPREVRLRPVAQVPDPRPRQGLGPPRVHLGAGRQVHHQPGHGRGHRRPGLQEGRQGRPLHDRTPAHRRRGHWGGGRVPGAPEGVGQGPRR
ncbi:MAG: glycerol-3-phosphate dehydrogenase/oxidase [Myxococcales bacterium]